MIVEMPDFTLAPAHEALLGRLVGMRVQQIVWDVNALYVVLSGLAVKIEVFGDWPGPSVSSDKYDELVFVRPSRIAPSPIFMSTGEEGLWYKVVAQNTNICRVEVARTTVVFPGGQIVNPKMDARGVLADVGVIFTLESGVVPAVLLENSFGFATWPEIRCFERSEALSILGDAYQLRSLTAAA